MRFVFAFFLTLTLSLTCFAQEELIKNKDLPFLNLEVSRLESQYLQTSPKEYWSFPQTVGNFFELKTTDPAPVIQFLKSNPSFEKLMEKFPNLQIDRNLLVLENRYTNRNGKEIVQLKSFKIGNSNDHLLSNEYGIVEILGNYFFTVTNDYETKIPAKIHGFYLPEPLKKQRIPQKYSDWLRYGETLVDVSIPIFFKENSYDSQYQNFERTILDSLVSYFEIKTNKPKYPQNGENYEDYRKASDVWQASVSKFTDSLFVQDKDFQNLLSESLEYAEKEKVSNGYLENFTAQLISKERALNLIRQNQYMGGGSFDRGPENQLFRIASLAAETHQWGIFIQAFLNIMNDRSSRVSDNNLASASRKTYAEELTKLNLDVFKLLLGINFRILAEEGTHYSGSGDKIAQAFASLPEDYHDKFEAELQAILLDPDLDDFNALHFYNTYLNYQYFMKNSERAVTIKQAIQNLEKNLPSTIRTRVENPNLELFELLYHEQKELDQFQIVRSSVANIISSDYDGDCWNATLIEKGTDGKIVYDLTMAIQERITPLSNFLEQMPKLKQRVIEHEFLQKLINQDPENRLYINFVTDRSFVDLDNYVTSRIPEEILKSKDFEDVISLNILHPGKKFVNYLLFKDKTVLMMQVPKDFSIPGYPFEALVTQTNEGFLVSNYYSYKLFDEKGNLLN